MRSIGIIGGMGPAATADFMARLVIATGAALDSDHPRVFVDSNPDVPDRNAARLGDGPSPGPVLAAMARRLVAQGAEILAMPCNAAHGWANDIIATTPVPFVSMIAAACDEALGHNPRCIGIIAIPATLDARLYHDRLPGITILDCDRAIVQPIVNAVKAGDSGAAIRAAIVTEAERLASAGADVIIAACTEVPLILSAADVRVPLIDATAALVRAVLAAARH